MRTVIDLVLLAIIIISIWSGYKKGFIMGIAGVVAIVVSLYAASLVSSAFSYEVVPALRPFASGYVESQMQDTVLEDMGLADTELSYEDILSNDPELRHDFCATCYKTFGIYDDAAEQMATEAETYADEHNSTIEEAIVEVLCTRVAYIAGVVLLFIIFLITLMTLANIPNLVVQDTEYGYTEPMPGGAAMGLLTGMLYCMLLSWILRFGGLAIGLDTFGDTLLAKFFRSIDFLTAGLGI